MHPEYVPHRTQLAAVRELPSRGRINGQPHQAGSDRGLGQWGLASPRKIHAVQAVIDLPFVSGS